MSVTLEPVKADGVVDESDLPDNCDGQKRLSCWCRGGRGERVDA